MDIIVVVPPVRKEMYDLFSRQHFEDLLPHITAFSLMTYDFSNLQRPGANAPLQWMRKAVNHICPETATNVVEKRRKILLGMNLYGNDFTPEGGGAIVGSEFLDLVRHVKGRLQLDDTNVENFFEVKYVTLLTEPMGSCCIGNLLFKDTQWTSYGFLSNIALDKRSN